jgi:leader peptidase (prepilin peptidase)/N-methyltransferase
MILFVFIIGICIGSFLNVVILRAFSNESIVLPPSKCPSCKTRLKWYHNIPILSYFILKGKCAFCEEKISIQYPIIELVTGLLFVAIFFQFGLGLNALFMFIFVSLFIVLAGTDIKEKVVFDVHTYILVGSGLIYNILNLGHFYSGSKILNLGHFAITVNNSFIASVLGILAGIIIMEAFARFGYLVAGTRAFGEGDTYIAAGLGAVFGWKYLITVLAYAFIIQVIATIPLFMKKLYTNKDYRTFISFLAFLSTLFIIKWLDYSGILLSSVIFTLLTIILAILGIYVCKRIITGLKDKSNLTYLPFGPAMVFGALIVIFFVIGVNY